MCRGYLRNELADAVRGGRIANQPRRPSCPISFLERSSLGGTPWLEAFAWLGMDAAAPCVFPPVEACRGIATRDRDRRWRLRSGRRDRGRCDSQWTGPGPWLGRRGWAG